MRYKREVLERLAAARHTLGEVVAMGEDTKWVARLAMRLCNEVQTLEGLVEAHEADKP